MGDEKGYQKEIRVIAGNIKKLRKARKLRQEDMVAHGFNYRHYQKIESGTYSFNLYTLYRLAKIFRVSLRDLFRSGL